MIPSDFAVLILTNRRPNDVITYETIRKQGYTGAIYLIVDNEDPTQDEYLRKYGREVILFNKARLAVKTPKADNIPGYSGSVAFARNACFEIAEDLGLRDFIQFDDDYDSFVHRFDKDFVFRGKMVRDLDAVLSAMLRYFRSAPFTSLAMLQGGDYIGGAAGTNAKKLHLHRKAMNSFICSVERPFTFQGRVNDDVSTYVLLGSRGHLFGSINHVNLNQVPTQSLDGGMSTYYRRAGTYAKSFYSVLHHPSSVSVNVLRERLGARIHHRVIWRNTVPKILRESVRKVR